MSDLQDTIERIDQLKDELDQLGPLRKDAKERLNQKIRLDWNYHSNVIEGNELSYGETRSLLLNGLTANGKPLKDHLDMKGHNEALKKLEQMAGKAMKITENLIKEFHNIIIEDPFKEHPNVLQGEYKRKSNYLYNHMNERVDFLDPKEVPSQLNELINWTNNAITPPKRKKAKYDTHPLLIAAVFHMRFINIHPFDDGNGRICRIFMNLILMQCGFPPIIIKSEDRNAYFRAIQKAREEGEEFLAEFLSHQLVAALELYIKAAKGEPIEEPDDLDKRIAILKQKVAGINEEEVKEVKTEAAIQRLIAASLIPLQKQIDEKLYQLKELFHNYTIVFLINSIGRHYDSIESLNKELFDNDREISATNSMAFDYRFDGFKKAGTETFSVSNGLEIFLSEWKYSISLSNYRDKDIYKGLYHQDMPSETIDKITNQLVGALIEQISRQIDLNEDRKKQGQ